MATSLCNYTNGVWGIWLHHRVNYATSKPKHGCSILRSIFICCPIRVFNSDINIYIKEYKVTMLTLAKRLLQYKSSKYAFKILSLSVISLSFFLPNTFNLSILSRYTRDQYVIDHVKTIYSRSKNETFNRPCYV